MTMPPKLFELSQDAVVEMYELDARHIEGGDIYHFTQHDNYGGPVYWKGQMYVPFPIQATGFERKANGALPRPNLAVSNFGGFLSAICRTADDLISAKVTRIRTFKKYLDSANFGTIVDPVLPGTYPAYTIDHVVRRNRASDGWYFNSSAQLVKAAANTARITYSGGNPNTLLGLLVEYASTNYLKRSRELAHDAWQKMDMTLPQWRASVPNLVPNEKPDTSAGTGWVLGANTSRIGQTTGPTGVSNEAVQYESLGVGNCYVALTFSPGTLKNNRRYKVAYWARRTAGTIGGSGNILSFDSDFDGDDTTIERVSTAMPASLSSSWQRYFLEFVTGAEAFNIGATLYLANDWDVGGRIAMARAVLVDIGTYGVDVDAAADFANLTPNDPLVTAPDTTKTAMKVEVKAGFNLFLRQQNFGALTPGNNFVPSIFVRYPTGAAFDLRVNDDWVQVTANVTSMAGGAYTGWKRVAFPTWTKGGGPDLLDFEVASVPANPFWVWGPQLEGGTQMTSFIESFDVPAVRVADDVSITTALNPTADPNIELPREVWRIDRRAAETQEAIIFEMAAPWDVSGVRLPRRIVVQGSCMWAYRSAECGYTGGPAATAADQPTTDAALDQCGKRVKSCKMRFGGSSELPFGGFPGVGQTTARS